MLDTQSKKNSSCLFLPVLPHLVRTDILCAVQWLITNENHSRQQNEVGGFSVSYHIDNCCVCVRQWQGEFPEWCVLIVDDAAFVTPRHVHQLSQKDLNTPITSINQLDKVLFSPSPFSRSWSQQVLTLDTCGLTLFRIICRHSAASRSWWTAKRVRMRLCSEVSTAVKSCPVNHSPFLISSHSVMLRVSHVPISILLNMCLSSLSTLLVVRRSLSNKRDLLQAKSTYW